MKVWQGLDPVFYQSISLILNTVCFITAALSGAGIQLKLDVVYWDQVSCSFDKMLLVELNDLVEWG